MNTQKQISLMVVLVFLLLGGCGAYTIYDQNRENSAAAYQQELLAERGARIFARYCRQCHGNAGQGLIGPALDRADLRDPNNRAQVTQWVTDTVSCGRIGTIMPPWAINEGGALDSEQILDLVTLITTGGNISGTGGQGWQKAAAFSAIENQAAPAPSVADVLAAGSITGANNYVCGQKAAATETPAAESGQLPSGLQAANTWTENATDNKFSVTAMAVSAGTAATVNFSNQGQAIHNWEVLDQSGAVLKDASGKGITMPLTDPGKSNTITFTISTPGVYTFRCQVHPTEMLGKLYVVGPDGTASAGGAAAAGTPAAGAAPSNSQTETMTDNKFSTTAMTVTSGQPVTIQLKNSGAAIHNFDVLNVTDDSNKPIKTDFINPGQSATLTFTISKKGTYKFQCDVHPTEMFGTFVVQ